MLQSEYNSRPCLPLAVLTPGNPYCFLQQTPGANSCNLSYPKHMQYFWEMMLQSGYDDPPLAPYGCVNHEKYTLFFAVTT